MSYQHEPGDDEYDPGTPWAEITVPADYFSCPTCHLVLDRYELIEQAGLPTTFEVVDDDPPVPEEPEYGND
jgi:rubredoxin